MRRNTMLRDLLRSRSAWVTPEEVVCRSDLDHAVCPASGEEVAEKPATNAATPADDQRLSDGLRLLLEDFSTPGVRPRSATRPPRQLTGRSGALPAGHWKLHRRPHRPGDGGGRCTYGLSGAGRVGGGGELAEGGVR